MQFVKNLESYPMEENSNDLNIDKDIMSDIRYICKSCSLITESLQKGSDVMQMPNGDIIITEIKTSTFQYSWDDKKGKLVRVQSGGRLKKNKFLIEQDLNKNGSKAKPQKTKEKIFESAKEDQVA